ncbi:MAG: hypothetical protein IAG13_32660, partial [Deltaproteobacteria bacterium]|nr:hypothetical protein [Nannocystaceae bacterium]
MPAIPRSLRIARLRAACALVALAAACGDDNASNDDGDASSSSSVSDPTVTPSTTQVDSSGAVDSSSSGVADESSSSGGSESTGGEPPTSCAQTALPGPIAKASWDERFTIAGLAGQDGYVPSAYDIAVDSDGSLLFAGYFRWGDGEAMEAIARHDDDGWHAPMASWGELELPRAGFSAVAVGPEGQLALATYDLAMNGDGEIWADTGAGPELIGQHAGALRRLLWKDGELWAVGRFQLADGGPHGLARWDGSEWTGAPGGDPDADVFEIFDDGDAGVIVAGEFEEIGGMPAAKVARWDGDGWQALDMPEAFRVLALERDGEGTLHAGGLFTLAEDNLPSASLARYNGVSWELAAGGVAAGVATGVISDLEWVDDAMIVAGCFDEVGGLVAADGIASLSDNTWASLAEGPQSFGTPWYQQYICGYEPDPDVVFLMPHQRIHHDGERLWLAGAFPGIDGVASQSVIVRDDSNGEWRPADQPGLGIGGSVTRLAAGGPECDTFAFVGASHVAGAPFDGAVARWTGDGWEHVAPRVGAGRYCPDFAVRANGEILVACGTDAGGGELLRLAGDSWETLALFPETVQDLVVAADDSVWIAGGGGAGYLARYDVGEPEMIEENFDGLVLRLAVVTHDDGTVGDVIVGGGFANVGGVAANRVARYDGREWSPLGAGVIATPSALAATPEGIWVGTYDEGTPGRLVLGRYDGGEWIELATAENGLAAPIGESSHTFTGLVPTA